MHYKISYIFFLHRPVSHHRTIIATFRTSRTVFTGAASTQNGRLYRIARVCMYVRVFLWCVLNANPSQCCCCLPSRSGGSSLLFLSQQQLFTALRQDDRRLFFTGKRQSHTSNRCHSLITQEPPPPHTH